MGLSPPSVDMPSNKDLSASELSDNDDDVVDDAELWDAEDELVRVERCEP